MVTFNPAGIYATNYQSGLIDTVIGSMAKIAIPEINPAQTLMVFNDNGVIKLYNLSSKIVTSISTVTALNQSNGGNVAHFTVDGKILFVDSADNVLKKMDTNGTNIVTVASPTTGYSFTYLALSPGRNKLAIIENAQGCADFYACNTERLVVMDAAGTNRSIIKSEYVGEWNLLSWRQDSQALLYYHHLFSGGVKGPAKYTLFDLSGGSVVTTDFSGGNWNTEENACFFTKTGNLLSLFNQELYDGRTGNLIANVSSTVPNMMTGTMMGWATSGDYYFADNTSGANFRRFVEPESLYVDFAAYGLYQYEAGTWTSININHPASMTASGSALYVDFATYGLYKYDAGTWTSININHPASMTASGSALYVDFATYGLYKYDADTWTSININHPASMTASGSALYVDFAAYGLYKYDADTWTSININHPASMTAGR
jgi:hypothetical protein